MTRNQTEESDWKNYKSIVPELRERYLCNRNKELIAILSRESLTPTENFWQANERIHEIEKFLGML